MSKISTKPPSGFRDFLPRDMRRRNRIFDLIREVYTSFGFEQLDTPCFENLSTLLGKYGDEGDQLIFKTLKRGDKLHRALAKEDTEEADIADAGLRYDLTVPLARIYAEYRNELPRYFKRFQIAPVWRADRPQKGRFREFYQCDVDVVGSTSMTVEAEVTAALATVLERLGFEDTRIHVNHRKVLRALIEVSGIPLHLETDTLVAIDKLDKIGRDGVLDELGQRGLTPDHIDHLMPMLDIKTEGTRGSYTNEATLTKLEEAIGSVEQGATAIRELRELFAYAQGGPAAPSLLLDPTLARGLSYYTGPIFEIRSDDFRGSLGGGGRYDDLIGMFSKQDFPACGFSLGVERLLVLMEERGMFGDEGSDVDVYVTLRSDDVTARTVRLASTLRAAGLRVDLHPEADKLRKQLSAAAERGARFATIMGAREVQAGTVAVKDLDAQEQTEVPLAEAADFIQARLSLRSTSIT